MNRILHYLKVLCVLWTFLGTNTAYSQCYPTYANACTSNDFIDAFSTTGGVTNITNIGTGCNGALPSNTTYLSSMTVSATVGTTINFDVTPGAAWSQGFRIWVDWNRNNLFESSESMWASSATSTTTQSGSFAVPASATSGNCIMRVMCRFNNIPTDADACATTLTYGETEDYNFTVLGSNTSGPVVSPFTIPPIANYAYNKGIDTAWANSPFSFVNNSTNDSASYWRIEGQPGATNCIPNFGCYHQAGTTRNFRSTFTDTGSYLVTLVVRNRTGIDSISKWIYVGYPSKKPVANFFMDKQVIGISEQIPVYDISENGPTSWEWYINPYCRACPTNTSASPNDFLSSANVQLPKLRARDAGKFDVCLKVWNNIGVDSICKKDYIEVIGGLSMCAGAGDTISTSATGYVYDNGGPMQSYFPVVMGNCYYSIAPCASSVTAYLETFKLRNQDSIIFRDGGATGPLLAKLGGGNIPASAKTIVAPSGRLFLQWQLGAPQNANVGDSGLVIRWVSTPATYGAPRAAFTCPDTVYSGQRISYTNTSVAQGIVTYTWDTNGDGIFNDYTQPNGANFTFSTVAPLFRDVCVRVSNCKGSNTFCKRILVLPVSAKPVIDFASPRPAGFTTDTFRLVDYSKNGPTQWSWSITPNNVTYVAGTDATSQNPAFMLNLPGKYTVKLRARNGLGIDSAEKSMFLEVLAYNSPNTDFPIANSSDVGISRVVFANIDTATALKTPVYDPIFNRKRAVLYRGVVYQLKIMRTSAITPMERSAWIDYNFDADFVDSGETIYTESDAINTIATANFSIPNNLTPGRITRLRIGVSEGRTTLTPDKARAGCFEDYGIEVGLDLVPPTIRLVGSDLIRVQRNTIFFDPGVLAVDNMEGNISSRYQTSTNLDMTQLGVYKVRYWVTDLYGNVSDTIERNVQVEINQVGPRVTLVGADTVRVEVRNSYLEQGATAIDNLGNNITNRIARISTVDTARIGTYYVNYSVNDEFGFTGDKTRVVIVQKTSKPTILAIGSNPAPNQGITKHQIFSTYNNGDGIVVQDVFFGKDQLTLTRTGNVDEKKPGSQYVQYTACDPVNNCSDVFVLQVDVQDTVPPVVSLLGPNPMEVDVYNSNFEDPGVNASDNYYSSNTLIKITQRNVNTNKLGNYDITYIVKDGSGNQTQITRNVKVVDKIAPTIELLGASPFELVWMDTFNLTEEIQLHDNYYSLDVLMPLVKKTTTLTIDPINGRYVGAERGWKEITYQVTDPSGNMSSTARRVVYVDFRSGLNEAINANNLNVYPNPSNGKFTVSVKQNLTGKTEIALYNMLGAKVFTDEVNTQGATLDVNAQGLKAGIYLLQVNNNGTTFTQRITIK